jgi:integrase
MSELLLDAAGRRRSPATLPEFHGLRGLIVVLWRAGLRIQEALALAEADLDPRRGPLLVRRGKGGRRREVGMDDWAWEQLAPWLKARVELPVGPLFCVVTGPTRGRPWAAAAARTELRRVARQAGMRRRFAPHRCRSSSEAAVSGGLYLPPETAGFIAEQQPGPALSLLVRFGRLTVDSRDAHNQAKRRSLRREPRAPLAGTTAVVQIRRRSGAGTTRPCG